MVCVYNPVLGGGDWRIPETRRPASLPRQAPPGSMRLFLENKVKCHKHPHCSLASKILKGHCACPPFDYHAIATMGPKGIGSPPGVTKWEKERAEACCQPKGSLSPGKGFHTVLTTYQPIALAKRQEPRQFTSGWVHTLTR